MGEAPEIFYVETVFTLSQAASRRNRTFESGWVSSNSTHVLYPTGECMTGCIAGT